MKPFAKLKLNPRIVALNLLKIVFVLYVTLFVVQRYLLFPSYIADFVQGELKAPADYQLAGFEEIHLTTDDKVQLVAWFHPPAKDMPVVLHLHGNGMHIAARTPRYHALTKAGFGVLALSWRGYGTSEGSPSEEGLYRDARAAMAYLIPTYTPSGIIVYGESLGSGVAVQMATEYAVAGVVLQSAYTSVANRACEIYWFLPGLRYLIRDPFDSISKIAAIASPTLILHGSQDTHIPIHHGKKLAQHVTAKMRFVEVEGAGHVNIPDARIVSEMRDFFIAHTYGNATMPHHHTEPNH